MPIRVLHIIGNLEIGGAQICVKSLVAHSRSEKVEAFVYPLRSAPDKICIDGNVIKLPYRNYDPRKFLAILRICKQYHVDIIHAHLEKPVIGALLANVFCKVPVVVHEHGPVFRKTFKYGLYRLALRIKATAKELSERIRIPKENITVVYNSVDTVRFKPDVDLRKKARQQLNVTENQNVIGFLGRLARIKGCDLLLDAFTSLSKTNPELVLVFAGDGPEMNSLKQQAKRLGILDKVKFLGFCSDVLRVINAFDIAVIPSRQESLGIAALELMSAKIPIVCSGVEGLAEIVLDNHTGLVTPQNTPEQIAACIKKLLHDKQLRLKLVENAAQFVTIFDVRSQIDAVEKIYAELLSNGR